MGWAGWIAALGGLLAILNQWVLAPYFLWIGGLLALIFGIIAAVSK
jgi:hypothetical protein